MQICLIFAHSLLCRDFDAEKSVVEVKAQLASTLYFLLYDKDYMKRDDFLGRIELSPAAVYLLQHLCYQANGGQASNFTQPTSASASAAGAKTAAAAPSVTLPPITLTFTLDSHYAARDERNEIHDVRLVAASGCHSLRELTICC